MTDERLAIPVERIEQRIYVIRGLKVMLDSDLAELYQVLTKRLNEAVKRSLDRFPEDFMFRLTEAEADALRSQSATSKEGRGGRRFSAVCIHRTGCRHAVLGAEKRARHSGEHRHHAGVRQAA